MPYYDTIEEDLARAKEILATGRPAHDEVAYLAAPMRAAALPGGTIYGADVYAAYKLLESFVAEIERLRAGLQRLDRLRDLADDLERLRGGG